MTIMLLFLFSSNTSISWTRLGGSTLHWNTNDVCRDYEIKPNIERKKKEKRLHRKPKVSVLEVREIIYSCIYIKVFNSK